MVLSRESLNAHVRVNSHSSNSIKLIKSLKWTETKYVRSIHDKHFIHTQKFNISVNICEFILCLEFHKNNLEFSRCYTCTRFNDIITTQYNWFSWWPCRWMGIISCVKILMFVLYIFLLWICTNYPRKRLLLLGLKTLGPVFVYTMLGSSQVACQ